MSGHAGPLTIGRARAAESLAFARLIPALRAAFIAGAETPLRHRHKLAAPGHRLAAPGATEASLLLMPAWQGRTALGVKIVTVFPENGALGLNAVSSTYLLCDGATGRHLAVIDGNEITGRRTAAASALAGDYLARKDARSLLVVGSGHVAGMLPAAWAAVREIGRVLVWNRNAAGAERLAAQLRQDGFDAAATAELEAATRASDIISCATLANQPLIRGEWLSPGAHLDLIGGYRPDMREADDAAVARARVFIDTDAALAEAGDITQALASGALTREAIMGDLFGLCRGTAGGRGTAEDITLFKSVGSAIEDLAAAGLVYADCVSGS
jgi:ornithine cyclodeaminase